ncbi:MAG: hypothetical protein CL799_07005 [Chromatiales bacterium]|nr:hypothetical protein [Chromatiales bacterium]
MDISGLLKIKAAIKTKLWWASVIIVLTVFLLFLLGFNFIKQTEISRQEMQENLLLSQTKNKANELLKDSGVQSLLAEAEAPGNWGEDLYSHKLPSPLEIDAYLDTNDLKARLATLRHVRSDGSIKLLVGTHDRYTYLYIEATDSSVRYFKNEVREWLPWLSDHIKIVTEDKEGLRRVLWVTPGVPDHFTAWYMTEKGVIKEQPAVRIVGQVMQGGYKVELRLPLSWTGNRLGVAAVDHDGKLQRGVMGSMQSDGDPGRLIRRSGGLEKLLSEYTKDDSDLQLSVVSKHGWLLAETGETKEPVTISSIPGSWILAAIYRYVMSNTESITVLPDAPLGRVNGDEVNRVLEKARGAEPDAVNWYFVNPDSEQVIVSIAVPLDVDGSGAIEGALVARQSSTRSLSDRNITLVKLIGFSALTMIAIIILLISYSVWHSRKSSMMTQALDNVTDPHVRRQSKFSSQNSLDEFGELGRSIGKLEKNTNYLQTYVSSLSHQFRGQLDGVNTAMENLREELGEDNLSPKAREYIERLSENTTNVSNMLENLGSLAKFEQSIQDAEDEWIDLSSLVSGCINEYQADHPDKSIELDVENEAIDFFGNSDSMKELLDKLFENACDFCSKDGVILVGLKRRGKETELTVENDGPQLPPGMSGTPPILSGSVRIKIDDKVHFGLGLQRVQLIVGRYKGTWSAANRDDGSGVRFTVTVPLG